MEFINNLGKPISSKTVTIDQLPNGNGYVVLGTPQLTFDELNELLGVIHHQIEYNARINKKKGEDKL